MTSVDIRLLSFIEYRLRQAYRDRLVRTVLFLDDDNAHGTKATSEGDTVDNTGGNHVSGRSVHAKR